MKDRTERERHEEARRELTEHQVAHQHFGLLSIETAAFNLKDAAENVRGLSSPE